MNLPNKLTLLRIAMIPVFVIFALMKLQWAQYVALLIYILACLTDLLDGKIARKNNLVTDFGKFADPIADKLLVMAALIILVESGRMASSILTPEQSIAVMRIMDSVREKWGLVFPFER